MTISYSVEPLSHARCGIEALIPDHWAKDGDSDLDCNPNWPLYEGLDRAHLLILIVARDDTGEVIGYLFGIMHRHPNTGGVMGTLSTFYICEHRHRAFLYRSLVKAGADEAFRRGAEKVVIKNKYGDSFGMVLEALGFMPTTVEHAMIRQRTERAHG